MKTLIILSVIATMMVKGCDNKNIKHQHLPLVDGVYSGTFTLITPTGSLSGGTSIEINGNRFVATGKANRIPAGGSGSFSLSDDMQTINFVDENFWTADFDWSLILSGEFVYSFDGENLEFSRHIGDGSTVQRYQLTKK